jgi:hypothetical protein
MRVDDVYKQPEVRKITGALRLANAMRQAKIAAADRGDSIVDVKEAEIARLELLKAELQSVFDAVPANIDIFDFTISSGMQRRLWLDAVAFVMLGSDGRTYKFVRDGRQGRVIMTETPDIKLMSESVTAYIAERLIEREQLLAQPQALPTAAISPVGVSPSNAFWQAVAWFVTGAVVGAVVLFLIFQERLMPMAVLRSSVAG